jgi:hypothetical protein
MVRFSVSKVTRAATTKLHASVYQPVLFMHFLRWNRARRHYELVCLLHFPPVSLESGIGACSRTFMNNVG